MVSKYDLTTVQIPLSGANTGTDLGLGVVPDGKTRFIIGVKINCITLSNTVTLGEAAAATGALTTDKLEQKVNDTFEYPKNPDIDTPIFKIDGETYLGAIGIAGVTDTELTVIYYDE